MVWLSQEQQLRGVAGEPRGGAVNRIGDYGMIGDCHSLALVGPDGSIDWLCFPRFDSPSVFGRTLDADAGHFRVAPSSPVVDVRRTYLPSTNVLETTFVTVDGEVELTDCMPVGRSRRKTHASTTAQIGMV